MHVYYLKSENWKNKLYVVFTELLKSSIHEKALVQGDQHFQIFFPLLGSADRVSSTLTRGGVGGAEQGRS